VLVPLLVARLSDHGLSGVLGHGQDLVPALAFVPLVGAGVVLGVRSLRRGILASRALARRVRSLALELPERYHVRNLDPLKVLLVRALPATFFFVPALAALRSRYVAGRELAADRRAVRACGHDPLVGALLKVVRGPAWGELQAAAAIGGSELLDLRIAQLESGSEPRLGAFTARRRSLPRSAT